MYITSSNGILTSPNYPSIYEPYMRCVWIITVPNKMTVRLQFIKFRLEFTKDKDCIYPYVELRNGVNKSAPLLGKYCGNNLPPDVYADSGSLWVAFATDNSQEGSYGRFVANFTSSRALSGKKKICFIMHCVLRSD